MFTQAAIPAAKILTRYFAPFGLTALLRPGQAGQPVESFWVGEDNNNNSGIVLFVSALDAEIYRLHAQTQGEEWVRHPFETIGFQQTVEQLGQAWTHLAFGFNANAAHQLVRNRQGDFILPCFPSRFGPLDEPNKPATFRFHPRMFEEIARHWTRIGGEGYAKAIHKINHLGATSVGTVELGELAERALNAAQLAPVDESCHAQIDWALFAPDAGAWRFGPNQAREHLH